MSRNNVKLLTSDELAHFNKRYKFTKKDDNIIVTIDDYNRTTVHPIDKAFSINAKKIRKLCFTEQAIDLWVRLTEMKLKRIPTLVDVQQAVNTFLKMYDVRTTIVVYYTENSTTVYNVEVPDHTIIVGLNAALRGGVYALEDMLRYILPTGYGLYIYFYQSLEDVTTLIDTNEAVLVYVSDDINSNVRTVIDNEYVGVQVGDSIEKEDWATKAVLCSNSAMNVTIRWDVYRNKVAEVPEYLSDRYLKLVFDYDGSSWNLFGKVADPEEYGLNVSGTPSANDTITVVSAVDELIGAVDTVEVKNDLPETGNQFNVSIIDDSTQHDS